MAAFLFHNSHQIHTVDDTATIKNKPGIQLFFYLCLESNTELFVHTSGYLNPPSHVHNPMYAQSGNFSSLLDLLSIHMVFRLPNFDSTFALVSTFIIQSFIMYRQSVGKLVVCESVHNPMYDMHAQCGNFNSFLDLLSIHMVCRLPNFDSTFALVSTFIIQSFIMYRQCWKVSCV